MVRFHHLQYSCIHALLLHVRALQSAGEHVTTRLDETTVCRAMMTSFFFFHPIPSLASYSKSFVETFLLAIGRLGRKVFVFERVLEMKYFMVRKFDPSFYGVEMMNFLFEFRVLRFYALLRI